MTEPKIGPLRQKYDAGVKAAVAQALERHRRLGESIAVWRDGQVVILSPDQILPTNEKNQSPTTGDFTENDNGTGISCPEKIP